jgi:hypothetical protein
MWMKLFNGTADIFALPDTWQQAARRYLAALAIFAVIIMLDHWLHMCAPAFAAGYAIGGLTMYGSFMRHCKV